MVLEDDAARLEERKTEGEERTAELQKRGLIHTHGVDYPLMRVS